MIHILQIDHLVLRVSDMARMVAFYTGVLGCSVEREQASIGLVQLRAGASLIDLVAIDGVIGRKGGAAAGVEGRNMEHFCLRIDAFDEASLRLEMQAAGVVVGEVGDRYGADGLGPSIYFDDPEGNTVELKGSPWPLSSASTSTSA